MSIFILVCLLQVILAPIDLLEHFSESHWIEQKEIRIFVMSNVLKIKVCTSKQLNKSNYGGPIKARRYLSDQLRSQFYKILIQIYSSLHKQMLQNVPLQTSFLLDILIQIAESKIHKNVIVESIQFLQQVLQFSERCHNLMIFQFRQMICLILTNNRLVLGLVHAGKFEIELTV